MATISGLPKKKCSNCFSFSSFTEVHSEERRKRAVWVDIICDSCEAVIDTVKIGHEMQDRTSKPSLCPNCKSPEICILDFGENWEEVLCLAGCGFLSRFN